MPSVNDNELDRCKRELHAQIARSRRRVENRCRGTHRSARQLLSWRTYVARYPLWSVAAALGAGMIFSAGFKPSRVSRRLGALVMRRALGGVKQRLWTELHQLWTDSTPNR